MPDAKVKIIDLHDGRFAPIGEGNGLREVFFSLSAGEACAVDADLPDDGHLFLRALATLNAPVSGRYEFQGRELDFSDYRKLLPYKKRIGYIAPDAALIVNRSIQHNIILTHAYFNDWADGRLTEEAVSLCGEFGLSDKLDLRPAQLDREDLRLAIIVRELVKSPDVLLVERPRDFLGPARFEQFARTLKNRVQSGISVVVLSSDKAFVDAFADRRLRIENGFLKSERQGG